MEMSPREKTIILYDAILKKAREENRTLEVMAELGRRDLFFMLVFILGVTVGNNDFCFARCREVQANPNGFLDLWAREHFKSTIITYALTIQTIALDREVTIGIFSFNRPIAKGFLKQIKRAMEDNQILKACYPEVFYENPQKESPSWSEDNGITVKRKAIVKEATVEAWGMIEGLPTGRHFKLRIYDDVINEKHVRNPDMVAKVLEQWELSLNLGSEGGLGVEGGGAERYIGTRYAVADVYNTIIDRKAAIPRIYPATEDGTPEGEPVLLSRAALAKKYASMGPHTFGCLDGNTQILMADWSVKPIHAVQAGDVVVGWSMNKGERSKLVPTKVLATQHHRAETVNVTMQNGAKIICTPDHKWWTGRRSTDRGREVYRSVGMGYNETSSLCPVLDITDNLWPDNPNVIECASYLAGIFDGEGTVSGGSVHISQCERTHPEVVKRIRHCLDVIELPYSEHRPKGREHQIDFYLTGGRQTIFRFLMLCDPAKRMQISSSMFKSRIGAKERMNVVSVESGHRQMVYNIETETGNYIANGFCSKNCQMLQNPRADISMGFKEEWLNYLPVDGFDKRLHTHGMNLYLLVDPAGSKKKGSDYTVMVVVGLSVDGNYYLIDAIRDRMNLHERTHHLLRLHRMYRPLAVGYERYGMQSDIEHIQYIMDQEQYHFKITELAGQVAKVDRIRRLVPIFARGGFYLPVHLYFIDYEGKQRDFVAEFIKDEYLAFPVAAHDDMLDCIARIVENDLGARFPRESVSSYGISGNTIRATDNFYENFIN